MEFRSCNVYFRNRKTSFSNKRCQGNISVSIHFNLRKIKDNSYEFPENIRISPEAKEIIQALLHPNPNRRPSILHVLEQEFFRSSNRPLSIPPTALETIPENLKFPAPIPLKKALKPPSKQLPDTNENCRNASNLSPNTYIQSSKCVPPLHCIQPLQNSLKSEFQSNSLNIKTSPNRIVNSSHQIGSTVNYHSPLHNSKTSAVNEPNSPKIKRAQSMISPNTKAKFGSEHVCTTHMKTSSLSYSPSSRSVQSFNSNTLSKKPSNSSWKENNVPLNTSNNISPAIIRDNFVSNGRGSNVLQDMYKLLSNGLEKFEHYNDTNTDGLESKLDSLGFEEDNEQNDQHPEVFITKWIDYSNKYGVGYQLRDGSVGVYFNDATSIILSSNQKFVFY